MDDTTRIFRELYQGGVPRSGSWLQHLGFDVLVLAAEEHQPSALRFPGVRVIHFPLDDDSHRWSASELGALDRLSSWLAESVRRGRKVLVTCQLGLNRSGLIVAATVMKLTGAPADEVVRLLRQKRDPFVLCNGAFVTLLRNEVSSWPR